MSDPRLGVHVLHEQRELADLAERWRALSEVTPLTSAFESWAWNATTAEILVPEEGRLRVFVVEDGGEPVAIFPMVIGRRGMASFLGAVAGNYSGPVYEPAFLEPATGAWARTLSVWPDVDALDLAGLRGGTPFTELARSGLPGWGRPSVAETDRCPEVDLGGGADAFAKSRSPKTWRTLRRRWRRLEERGRLEVAELVTPEEVVASLPRIFALFEARWEGQRVSGGFVPSLQPFHRLAARRLAESGAADLFVLRLEGQIISYLYGMRARGVTTSYATAYDGAFSRFSPGLLVHWRAFEHAAARGDPFFDLSLGDFPYKEEWPVSERAVCRLRFGRGRRVRGVKDRLRVRARSVPALRELKLRGPAALVDRVHGHLPARKGRPGRSR